MRLGILTTHPIQYQAPWFRALAARADLRIEVLFCHRPTGAEQADAGFGVEFQWDIPVLEGYPYRFLKNVAHQARLGRFTGLDTPEVGKFIKSRRYDAVLVNGWYYKSAWQAIFACWAARVPVLVRSDSHLMTPRARNKVAVKHIAYRLFIPRFTECLAVGTWSREYFIHYGANPRRVYLAPHTVDVERFMEARRRFSPNRHLLRSEWGLSPEQVVFMFAGKFIEKKRPEDFVHAIKIARELGAHAAGLMVGDGPLQGACAQAAFKYDLPIRFTGFLNQSEIVRAYAVADVLVLPSDGGETWGLVVNEAMAMGLPCIVSDKVGCGPDLIIEGNAGSVFQLGNVAQLAHLMVEYSDRGTRDAKASATQRVVSRFTPESVAEMTAAAVLAARAVHS